eukprot:7381869-Pyramimonas_sp.AAC.1
MPVITDAAGNVLESDERQATEFTHHFARSKEARLADHDDVLTVYNNAPIITITPSTLERVIAMPRVTATVRTAKRRKQPGIYITQLTYSKQHHAAQAGTCIHACSNSQQLPFIWTHGTSMSLREG